MLESNNKKTSDEPMRANCPFCNTTVPIESSKKISSGFRTGYSKCSNSDCEKFSQTLVYNLSFSHCVEKKTQNVIDDIQAILRNLPAHQRNVVLEDIAS